jgi:hypothetical protein
LDIAKCCSDGGPARRTIEADSKAIKIHSRLYILL